MTHSSLLSPRQVKCVYVSTLHVTCNHTACAQRRALCTGLLDFQIAFLTVVCMGAITYSMVVTWHWLQLKGMHSGASACKHLCSCFRI